MTVTAAIKRAAHGSVTDRDTYTRMSNILTPTAAIKRAVICGEFEGAVDCCFRFGRLADALLLAATGGRELFQRTQERYLALNAGQPFVKVGSRR